MSTQAVTSAGLILVMLQVDISIVRRVRLALRNERASATPTIPPNSRSAKAHAATVLRRVRLMPARGPAMPSTIKKSEMGSSACEWVLRDGKTGRKICLWKVQVSESYIYCDLMPPGRDSSYTVPEEKAVLLTTTVAAACFYLHLISGKQNRWLPTSVAISKLRRRRA